MGKALNLVLIGFGNAAEAVAALAKEHSYEKIFATTRSEEKKHKLFQAGLHAIVGSLSNDSAYAKKLGDAVENAHVLISFPPDGETDEALEPVLRRASKIIYISTTGVFGGAKGVVDENTPVDARDEKTKNRLAAEKVWMDAGGIILRAPGLYGPGTGLHLRLKSGSFKLPGSGANYISRIHLDDLAEIILSAFEKAKKSSLYVVGDLKPSPQREVVEFLCSKLKIEMPDSIPIEEAHVTVRGNRQVVAKKILEDLSITLKYPTYKEGYNQCLQATAMI